MTDEGSVVRESPGSPWQPLAEGRMSVQVRFGFGTEG